MGIGKFYTHYTMMIVSKYTLKFIVLLFFLGAYLLCCLPSLEHGLGQSSSVLQAIYAVNKILPK